MGPNNSGGKFGMRLMETGGCYNGLTKKRCVLDRRDCLNFPGEIYQSYFQVVDKGDDTCDPNDMVIGRCLTDGVCAPERKACKKDTDFEFEEKDFLCTIQRDKKKDWDVNNPDFTLFGSCKVADTNSFFCAYSISDCASPADYMTPAETKDAGRDCDCSKVRVTGCFAGGDLAYCAVNADSCGQTDDVISPYDQTLQLEENTGNLDCRLCKKINTKKPTLRPTVQSTASPTETPISSTPVSFSPTLSPVRMPSTTQYDSEGSGAVVAAAISGGSIFLLSVVGFLYWFLFRKKGKEFDTALMTPPSDIVLS